MRIRNIVEVSILFHRHLSVLLQAISDAVPVKKKMPRSGKKKIH